eukprot:8232530-Ditylum_brightwellii.AAC.2
MPLLNLDTNGGRFTAMINIPHSKKVKLIHGVGVGASAIGAALPTDRKLLMLSGEGNKMLGCPTVFCLPAEMRQKVVVKCPTEAAFQVNLQGGNNPNSWHRFAASVVPSGDTAEVLQIAVVPPFVVFDGFCGDIEAEDVYKQILSLNKQAPTWVIHAKAFLRACSVRHNTADEKQHVDMAMFTDMPPHEVKVWAKEKFEALHPLPSHATTTQQQQPQQNMPALM